MKRWPKPKSEKQKQIKDSESSATEDSLDEEDENKEEPLKRKSRRKRKKSKSKTPAFLSQTASGRTPKATSRWVLPFLHAVLYLQIYYRYVAENTEPPAKKTKESEGIKKLQIKSKELEKSDIENDVTMTKTNVIKNTKINPLKLTKEDLIKVPELNVNDENLTPPVLEPIYPDVKVSWQLFRTLLIKRI